MKFKILTILSLKFIFLNSQEIKFPFFEHRDSKLITINSVLNTANNTVLNMQYMCSYKYDTSGFFNINENSYIATTSKKYKLIEAKNIELSPNNVKCTKGGQLNNFELTFEKLDDTVKEFHLIECPDKTDCFNIYGINIEKSNDSQFDGVMFSNKIKNDEFLKYFDPILQDVFENPIFVMARFNFNDYFEKIIEMKYENNELLNTIYSDVKITEKEDKNIYTFILKEKTNIVPNIEFYVYKEKDKAYRIQTSIIYFNDEKELERFFKSFCDYYGYSSEYNSKKKYGFKYFDDYQNNNFYISNIYADITYENPRILIFSYTDKEYNEIVKD